MEMTLDGEIDDEQHGGVEMKAGVAADGSPDLTKTNTTAASRSTDRFGSTATEARPARRCHPSRHDAEELPGWAQPNYARSAPITLAPGGITRD
jgi:hypothetical protein